MRHVLAIVLCLIAHSCLAQTYKLLPPPGIEIDAAIRKDLQVRVDGLNAKLQSYRSSNEHRVGWLVDVKVLVRAVDLALDQNLFYQPRQAQQAVALLDEAERRLASLPQANDRMVWLGWDRSKSGEVQTVVGGFQSRIDDSVQPVGVVLPAGFRPGSDPYRLDVWLHGRGDSKTEIPFLIERMSKAGQYTPENTVVLHPFGRHCNAFKFAGEVDVLEAVDDIASRLPVDRDRISIRGFSMGGAGCWHMAVHYPGTWFAANPGAGFVDTIVYQGWRDKQPFPMNAVRRKLLRWYDVLPWVENLRNTQVVAYSGEVDKQRQAADRVMDAAADADISLEYVIGKKMGHKIDAPSIKKIAGIMEDWARGTQVAPRKRIDLVTYTLRYPGVDWLRVNGLKEHWIRSTAQAELVGDDGVKIMTDGITHLTLDFSESGYCETTDLKVEIDDDRLLVPSQAKEGGFKAQLIQTEDGWFALESADQRLRKRAGLQGPIDDAFCDRFLFVLPSRPAKHGGVQRWISRELDYARSRWKTLMRGDVREVLDRDLTKEQIENNHLICFGDFSSNQFLRDIQAQLPLEWTPDSIKVGSATFDSSSHAPVLCYPNPRNADRYVVVNSGMTFREFSNVSNSRQIAMLPDWAVIDVTAKNDGLFAGRIAAEGFFDEQWQLRD
ncbi:MAG: hypothetical protein GY904_10530 [Planctomycetaceae bacterium]|nr:hypothetical protein [Planctomycetaceae bacterium]